MPHSQPHKQATDSASKPKTEAVKLQSALIAKPVNGKSLLARRNMKNVVLNVMLPEKTLPLTSNGQCTPQANQHENATCDGLDGLVDAFSDMFEKSEEQPVHV
jgi:hypothetical protein